MRDHNNDLESRYKQILDKISPQIEKESFGILHTVIHIILQKEKANADKICSDFKINKLTSLETDFNFADKVIHKPVELHLKLLTYQQSEREKIMKSWIVLIACVLVGALGCIKFLENTQKQEDKRQGRNNGKTRQTEKVVPVVPPQPVTAALCLVVPASVASTIKDQPRINTYLIEALIDKASYFMCTNLEIAELLKLEFTNEDITKISENREVFVRINIQNGQEMIGKTSTYILKRNLSSSGEGNVVTLAPLKNLSGLEKFYCV
ncbi:hypothetical protein GTQ43_16755 [Nostoc sp. KVJ3]|uniref:hypothetical protein n=1 Tax=Nostoc sp. KVJ3 TaxID=457945 RepID=UPI0022382146|nr:hypothetical protein [Nostoc sp. KVJ3]MCW5315399.1 hypothetical protein [Nostoc sp. KVJ3]